jgi:general secretion pathway protein J
LIELMVAIALMAVLAVLGWRGLDSVLRSRERIVASSDAMRSLSLAFTQIEEDLRRSWSVRLVWPSVQTVGFQPDPETGTDRLLLLREGAVESGGQVQRIVYRIRGGTLERGFAPWVPGPDAANAMSPGAMAPPPEPIWQPLVEGVTALSMRGWVAQRGWLPAEALPMRATLPADAAPVTGVEVLLERGGGDRVLRVFPVRD